MSYDVVLERWTQRLVKVRHHRINARIAANYEDHIHAPAVTRAMTNSGSSREVRVTANGVVDASPKGRSVKVLKGGVRRITYR